MLVRMLELARPTVPGGAQHLGRYRPKPPSPPDPRPALLALVLLLLAGPLYAQPQEPRVSMWTILPGDDVYAAYGHSALHVYEPAQGIDHVFNYGTFTFDTDFLPKFLYGELDYHLSVVPYRRALAGYQQQGRPVVAQVLDLTPAQRAALFTFLRNNAREENKYYRYDFLYDNCATRIRDAFETIFPETFSFGPLPAPEASFRDLIDPYVADQRFLDMGIDLLLGATTDREATAREAMFLPDYLFDGFATATLARDSTRVPLVARTDTILWVDGYARTQPSFPWAALLMWLLFGGVAWRSFRQWQRGTPSTALDRVVFGLTGLVGVILAGMWFLTLHHVTANNLHLLWAWPTHLVAAFLLGRAGAWQRSYFGAAAGFGGVLVLGWFFWPQAMHPALLPVALIVVLRSGLRALQARQ